MYSELSTGDEINREITSTSYELFYYDDAGQRQDLEEAIRRAIDWCDRELTALEKKLPPRFDPELEMKEPPPHAAKPPLMTHIPPPRSGIIVLLLLVVSAVLAIVAYELAA